MAADEDCEVFEIMDCTTASDWERFIARIEEILHKWKLITQPVLHPASKGEYTSGTWEETTEQISFADFKFTITHHVLKSVSGESLNTGEKERISDDQHEEDSESQNGIPTFFLDMMSTDNDFPSRAHCLCRWYGLRDFVIISPIAEAIKSESRSHILVSSVNIALNNTGCPVPIFVQVLQKKRKCYIGVATQPGLTTEFDIVHLKEIPAQYNHLAGLLDVFKAKLGLCTGAVPPVEVTVRCTYALLDWIHTPWPQMPPDFSSVMEGEIGCTDFERLPFGACEDPVSELHLSCTWPSLSEEIIVENQAYSDLDPLQAPLWSVRIQMTVDPQCLLGDYLRKFTKLCNRRETTEQLLGSYLSDSDENKDMSAEKALQRLTEPQVNYGIPTISSVINASLVRGPSALGTNTLKSKEHKTDGPIEAGVLDDLLMCLFPDVRPEGSVVDERDKDDEKDVESDRENTPKKEDFERRNEFIKELAKQLKSAPLDSLSRRLAVCACLVNHKHGGLKAVAHLWQEFILEIRYRWENNYYLPGIEPGTPNMGCCILHQKLQMLNCCIERKIKREEQQSGSMSVEAEAIDVDNMNTSVPRPTVKQRGRVESSSEDDEFYECKESPSMPKLSQISADSEMKRSDSGDQHDVNDVEMTDSLGSQSSTTSDISTASYKESVSYKPDGRSRPCGQLRLLVNNEVLYIPITQEPSPMTEDILEEHAEVLTKLGTSQEGAELRARMQSSCLMSDMESFKAANPGCILEDFVRWYSPRDWLEEEEEDYEDEKDENADDLKKKGQLSHRMQISGNMWLEAWQSTKPIPARRQRRLFDDTKEAEKVLHFLSSLKPAQVVLCLLPMVIHEAILTILDNEDPDVFNLNLLLKQILNKSTKATRAANQDIQRYTDLVSSLSLAELVIARAKSLKSKFPDELLDKQAGVEEEILHFVRSLLSEPEVNVRGGPLGPAGSLVHRLFIAAQQASEQLDPLSSPRQSPTGTPLSGATLSSHIHAGGLAGTASSSGSDSQIINPILPSFPKPVGREYILRTSVARPAPYSRVTPQRMYCVLMCDDVRLAGAFTSDTNFQ